MFSTKRGFGILAVAVGSIIFSLAIPLAVFAATIATTLSISNNTSINYGDATVNLSATLTHNFFQGVSGVTVSFTLNNVAVGSATTTSNGTATLNNIGIGTLSVGNHNTYIGASFAGNTTYSSSSNTGTLTVNQKTLTVTGVTANNKVYDRTQSATLNVASATLQGVVGTDTVSLSTGGVNASFTSSNVGSHSVSVSGLSLTGAQAANYKLSQPTGITATITAKPLTVTGTTASNKIYDGTTTATVNTSSSALTAGGVISPDSVTLTKNGITGTFSDKNVGTGKTVTFAGFSISGSSATNYSITQPTSTANITVRPITITAATNTKVFDGTTSAAAIPTISSSTPVAAGDTANFIEAYSDATVGTEKTLIPSGTINDGNSGNNYNVTLVNDTTGVINAVIVSGPASITISADASEPGAGSIEMGTDGTTLAVYRVAETSDNEAVQVSDLTIFASSTAAQSPFINLQLFNGATLLGATGGSVPTAVTGGFNYFVHLTSPLTVPAGSSTLLTLEGDVVSHVSAPLIPDGTVTAFLVNATSSIAATGVTSNDAATITLANASGNNMTVLIPTASSTPSVTITPVSPLPNATLGSIYSQTLTASTTATGPFTWTIASGALPAGLSLGTSTGPADTISGTPTAAGTFNVNVGVTNGSASTTQAYAITVGIPLSVNDGLSSFGCTLPTSGNLIGNPTMQTSTNPAFPNCWGTGAQTGTSTDIYTFPAAGPNGTSTNAAQVTVSNYQSGDAKWYFQPVSVQGNGSYMFSDSYNSTTTTQLLADYTVTNGATSTDSFVALATLGPTNGWATTTLDLDAPANATAVTIFHLLAGNGSLSIANDSLTLKAPASQNLFPTGVVSITFDDGWESQYTNALPVLQAANLPATFYIITNTFNSTSSEFVGVNGYMTPAQVLALQSDGMEIGAHTMDHCDLVKLSNNPNSATINPLTDPTDAGCPDTGPLATSTTAAQEINGSRTALLNIGATPVDTFAYPYGSYNPAVESLIQNEGFIGARSVNLGFNLKNTDPYALNNEIISASTTDPAAIEQLIDQAAANKEWLILLLHQVELSTSTINTNGETDATTKAFLQTITNYLAAKEATTTNPIVVETMHTVLCGEVSSTSCNPTVTTPSISITPATPAAGQIGVAYSQTLAASTTAAGPFTWSIASGTLPTNLVFNASSTGATTTITGMPNATGTFNFNLKLTNGTASTTQPFAITIGAAPVISLGNLSNGAATVGVPYVGTITASSTNPSDTFNFSIASGTLPAWLNAVTSAATLTLSGTPPAAASSSFNVTVTGSNAASASTTRTYSITVNLAGISLTGTVPGTVTVGTTFPTTTLTVSSTDPGPFVWTVTGLPDGLTSTSTTAKTLAISGTPTTIGQVSTISVTATSQANASTTVTQTYPITISSAPTLSVTTSTAPTAFIGTSYSATVVASSTNPADTFTWTVNGAPSWMTVNGTSTKTLTLSGMPNATSTSNISISVTGANPSSTPVIADYALVTHEPSTVQFTPPAGAFNDGRVGDAYTPANVTVSDANVGDTFVITQTGGILPAGLTLATTPTGFTISGTPTTTASSTFTIMATSASDPDQVGTANYHITVDPPLPQGVVNVFVNVIGGPKSSSDFTITVNGGHASPTSTFPGNASGTVIGVDAGTNYTVGISTIPNYDKMIDASSNCGPNTLVASSSVTCSFTETFNGVFVPVTLSDGIVGSAYGPVTLTASTTINQPLTWSIVSGALPDGLTLDTTATSTVSTISGTPTIAETSNFTVGIANASGTASSTEFYTLTVDPAPVSAPAPVILTGSGGGGGGFYFPIPTPSGTSTTGVVLGASATNQLALLQSLLAQLVSLEQQLVKMEFKVNGCPATFTKNLSQGMTDAQVQNLQKVLNYTFVTQVTKSGAGSPGNESTYFGAATKSAVVTFQNIFASDILTPNGLVSGNGYVGAATRTELNNLCSQ
jgi:peptidoglycan/xylan/chitin deacetylase (PgdA/CDA1 family)